MVALERYSEIIKQDNTDYYHHHHQYNTVARTAIFGKSKSAVRVRPHYAAVCQMALPELV
jgi:hypothetical protein